MFSHEGGEISQLQAHDPHQILHLQGSETDHFINPIEEFRAELTGQGRIHLLLQLGVITGAGTGVFKDHRTGQVAGHHHHGVAEINGPSLGIGEAAIVENLQQQIEHIRVSLFHLIQQQHGVGAPTHRLGELSPFLVSDIARWCTDQTRGGVALHELAHVEAHQRLLLIEQGGGQRFGQLRFADPRRAKEQERTHRTAGILHPGPRPPDRCRDGGHRFHLADDPLGQVTFQGQQLAAFARQEALHRNTGPTGHQISDVSRLHLFPQQRCSRGLRLSLTGFQRLPPLLNGVQLVVLQPSRLLQIALPFRFSDGVTQVFVLLQQLAKLLQLRALLLPTAA